MSSSAPPSSSSRALRLLQAFVQSAANRAQDVALELSAEVREGVRTGLGIPRAVTSAASFTCFAVAAAGTASLTFDLLGKVYGSKECDRCSGWEAVACRTCRGTGRVRTATLANGLKTSVAAAALAEPWLEQEADSISCSTCTGSGVMTCPLCRGDAWKGRFTLDKIMDAPFKAWQIHRQCKPVLPPASALANESSAYFWMFDLPEIESGQQIPLEKKKKLWWQYKMSRRFDIDREVVKERRPGWQAANEEMLQLDPKRALEDSVFVPSLEEERISRSAAAAVLKLPVPKRPEGFGVFEDVVQEPDWQLVKDEDEKKRLQGLLSKQAEVREAVLEAQWRMVWQQQQVQERTKQGMARRQRQKQLEEGGAASAAGAVPESKTQQKKVPAKK